MLADFESKLDQSSEEISKFWQTLVNEKETSTLYEKGLKISADVEKI